MFLDCLPIGLPVLRYSPGMEVWMCPSYWTTGIEDELQSALSVAWKNESWLKRMCPATTPQTTARGSMDLLLPCLYSVWNLSNNRGVTDEGRALASLSPVPMRIEQTVFDGVIIHVPSPLSVFSFIQHLCPFEFILFRLEIYPPKGACVQVKQKSDG